MKKVLKKSLAFILALTMVFGAAPLAGLVRLELPNIGELIAPKAEAATYGVLTYAIQNGEVAITGCDTSASGDLVIPETIEGHPVTSIGSYAFIYCGRLTSVTIPEGVTSIGQDAFLDCTGLTSITIPGSVTSIGEGAFYGCSGLTSVTIPEGVTSIGENAFEDCTGLTIITVDGNNPNYSSDESGVLFNKNKTELIQYPVGNTRTAYAIPNSVTSIGEEAFFGCTGLTSVIIPNSVAIIGDYAFYNCDSIASVTIPASVTSIGDCAFRNCNSLVNISVDESNQYYSNDESGGLFNKDKTELIQYPIGNERTEYIIPNSVTSIGGSAFNGCYSLTSITIPNSVTSIGSYAFYDCYSLTNVSIPDSVTSIDSCAFYGCSELVNIKIGNGIKIIDYNAFSNTGYYNNEDNWVDNVLYIDNCLIEAKTDISGEYSIKEGTRIIPGAAFSDCRNLTGITIPGSVEYISSYAFSGCSNLSSATLENGINSIKDSAFKTCISLTSISIPDSVEKIGTNAFYGCLNLKTISIGSGIKSIGQNAFAETGYYINEDNWVDKVLYIDICLIKAKNDITGNYAVKDGATVIADYAFRDCDNLADVTIPNSVTNIGDYAFYDCYRLNIDSLPNSLTSIGDYAFYNCDSIASITIPASVTSIGDCAFGNCNSLKAITVDESNQYYSSDEYGVLFNKDKTELIQYPVGNERTEYLISNSVTSIGNSAFRGCTRLDSITISNSVTKIIDYAFYDCYNLTIDSLPSGLTSIGDYAFSNCNGLISVTIPGSVTNIGDYAFSNCNGLISVTIPGSVTNIGDYAFSNCNGLTGVTISNGVKSIGYNAFKDCYGLTSVAIPASVTSIGDCAFENCNNLKAITVDQSNQYYSNDDYGVLFSKDKTELIQYPVGNIRTDYIIPNSVTRIEYYAFAECRSLTSVSIPNSVTSIGAYAFKNCINLTINSLPNGLTSIGDGAFYNCDRVTSVTIPASVTYIGILAFSNCNNLEGIWVDENYPKYSSDNFGVLFNKNKTALMQYPIGNARTSYTVPETVYIISYESFENCKSLVSITIPKSVKSIYGHAFYSCDNLNTVYYSGSPSMWENISISRGNDKLKNATIIYAEEDSETGEVKKETVSDETTDVSVEYISNFHEGEVGLEVERTFDGKAFDVISTQLDINSNEIYDIKMTIDGVVTQPNGKVKVKIPIPAGYDPAKTFVYHVNTNTGTVENMNAVVDGNYLVFETDHFSYYAVVEAKDSAPDEPAEQSYKITWNIDGKITEQKYKAGDVITAPQNPVKSGYRFVGWSPAVPATMPAYDLTFTAVFEKIETPIENIIKVSIRNPSTTTIDYGDSIILHADIDGTLPAGARIEWTADNGNFSMSVSADGMTCKISPKSNGKTVFTATVYDKDGNVISSDTQEMTAKAGLWQKIVAFFKKIFGLTKTIPEAFKGIF